jgi:hypothetical protein
VAYLHLGNALIHEVFAGEMEGVGKMVDLLIGEQRVVGLELDYCGRPVNSPIFISISPFEAVLVEQLLDELHSAILKFVKVADLIMLGHVAYLGECIPDAPLPLFAFLVIAFLNPLDLLCDDVFGLQP